MARMKIISNDWSYLHSNFVFKGVVWRLIGSSNGNSLQETYDEFKGNNGKYVTLMRKRVRELWELKEIEVVQELINNAPDRRK